MGSTRRDSLPFLGGAVGAIGSWLLGYALTYLLVAPDLRESGLNRLIEALDGAPATYEMVGWVFFNAHFVDTVIRDIPLVGSRAISFVGGQNGFSPALYAIPVVFLVAAGFVVAFFDRPTDPNRGAVIGLTVLPGYLIASIAGAFLFEVRAIGASAGPDLLPAIVLAGIVYPVLFAGAGGALGGLLDRDR